MTCYGTTGSYAETYAKAKGMKFVAMDYSIVSMNFIKDEYQVSLGYTDSPVLNIEPANYSDDITYTSSDESIFTVAADGTVKGLKTGEGVLTAKSTGGIIATTIIKIVRPVSSVTISKTGLELMINEAELLTATVYPSDATDKSLIWTSSNESVATVEPDGKVKAKAAGTVTIKVTSSNGKSASSTVTVSEEKKGDITDDGEVAMNDVVKMARVVSGGVILDAEYKKLADMTGDGVVAMNDVVKLARFVSGTIDEL